MRERGQCIAGDPQSVWPDTVIVFIVSGLLATLFASVGYITFVSNSGNYTQYALTLVRGEFNPNLAERAIGYPALLILTGFGATGSLAGILALQALTGAAIPAIAAATLQPVNRWVAIVTSATLILSLTPFMFINMIYPDQFYVFLLIVIAAMLSRWLIVEKPLWLYLACVFCLFLAWVRPAGLALMPLCIGLAVLYRRRHVLHAVIGTAAIALILVATDHVERRGSGRSYIGEQAFFNAYLWSDGLANAFSMNEDAKELRTKLKSFFETNPGIDLRQSGSRVPDEEYELFFGRFSGKPDAQVDAMFARPRLCYYWRIAGALPEVEADGILLRATLRHYWEHPWQLFRSTLSTYAGLVLGPAWRFNSHDCGFSHREKTNFEPFTRGGIIPIPERDAIMSLDMFAIKTRAMPEWMLWVQRYFAVEYSLLLPTTYILMLIGVAGFARSPGAPRAVAVVTFGIHSINTLLLSMLVDPQFRYQVQNVPLAIVGAGIGLYRLTTIYQMCSKSLK